MTGPVENLQEVEELEEPSEKEDDYEEEEEDCGEPNYDEVGGLCGDQFFSFEQSLDALGFEYIGCGGFRRVYRRKGIVIKVPRVGDGIVDNRVEAAAWRKYKNKPTDQGLFLAACRLLPNGCLMMVALEPVFFPHKPEWASKIDSSQVGKHKGRVVAYDFALDVSERDQWEEEWDHRSCFFQDDWLFRKPHLRKKSAA